MGHIKITLFWFLSLRPSCFPLYTKRRNINENKKSTGIQLVQIVGSQTTCESEVLNTLAALASAWPLEYQYEYP